MTDVPLISRMARANTKDLAHFKRLIITKELLATKSFPLVLSTNVINKKNSKTKQKLRNCKVAKNYGNLPH